MNKKGSEMVQMLLIKIILVLVIGATLFYGITKVSDNTIHTERAKVRDFSLAYDVASLSSGKLNLIYNLPQNYSLSVDPKNCKVEVMESKKNIPSLFFCNQYDESTKVIAQNKIYYIQKNV